MHEPCRRLQDSGYDFELEKTINAIREGGHRRLLIQLPEGVKSFSQDLAKCLRMETGARATIFADPTWGACDIPVDEAARLGATLVLHYGHTEYSLQPQPLRLPRGLSVLYIPLKSTHHIPQETLESLHDLLEKRGLRRPVLTATVQHLEELPRVSEYLERRGMEPIVARAPGSLPGQVIGCDYRTGTPSVGHDSVVIVAGGVFHPLGLALSTEKPVFQVDPYRLAVEDLGLLREKWLRKRYAVIYKALDARVWGVWLGSMTGQYRRALADAIERLIEQRGGEWVEFYSRTVTPRELRAVDTPRIDAHVVTSCPRVPTDDFTLEEYPKPVLSPGEALMVLKRELQRYRFMW